MIIKNLIFPEYPCIYKSIQLDYDDTINDEEMVELAFLFFKLSETSDCKIKRLAYYISATAIYSEQTGKTFESKIKHNE